MGKILSFSPSLVNRPIPNHGVGQSIIHPMSHQKMIPISGTASNPFEPLRQIFEQNIQRFGEHGASFCVIHNGSVVVDLWGGFADKARKNTWRADTITNVWSTTKGLLALAMHMLADRGLVDFQAPVAQYWPEFSRNGKEKVLVGHVLAHTAGLPAPSRRLRRDAIYNWDQNIKALEESALWFEPGKYCSYHAITYGFLAGEILRRVTGQMPGDWFRGQITSPLQADFFSPLRLEELPRCAEMITPPRKGVREALAALKRDNPRLYSCETNLFIPLRQINSQRWRMAPIPAGNGHASARGLARMYAPLSLDGSWNGLRILSEKAAAAASKEIFKGEDYLRKQPIRRAYGFERLNPGTFDPRLEAVFGHGGWGGSIGLADPVRHLAIGFVTNRMIEVDDQRFSRLVKTLYDCLGVK